jgi:hypothetical protein
LFIALPKTHLTPGADSVCSGSQRPNRQDSSPSSGHAGAGFVDARLAGQGTKRSVTNSTTWGNENEIQSPGERLSPGDHPRGNGAGSSEPINSNGPERRMKYLNTNDVGFDRTSIGFPSVKTCMAIVYQTIWGLFGFHDALGNDRQFGLKGEAFQSFVQNVAQNHQNSGDCLIAVINGEERFFKDGNGRQLWSQQLQLIAELLRFRGPIWGVRLSGHIGQVVLPGNVSNDSAYIRFDYEKGRSKVSYKTMAKMEWGTATNHETQNVHALLEPHGNQYTPHVPRLDNRPVQRRGRTDEGNLNVVKNNEFIAIRA